MTTTLNSSDGTALAARRSGAGTPLVLVHGANGDLDTFAFVEPLLAEHHTVWTYSRRGRGGSGDGPDYSVDREVEDLCAVVDAAGSQVHVVAHCGGAAIALLAAPRLPALRSLVLYEPPLRVDGVDPETVEALLRELEADVERGLEAFFPLAGITEEEAAVVRSIPEVWDRACVGARLAPREIRTALAEADRLTTIEQPDAPTLYLYGEETVGPWFLDPALVRDRLPKAEVHGIPAQRHLAHAFAPDRFAAEVLSFTGAADQAPVP